MWWSAEMGKEEETKTVVGTGRLAVPAVLELEHPEEEFLMKAGQKDVVLKLREGAGVVRELVAES